MSSPPLSTPPILPERSWRPSDPVERAPSADQLLIAVLDAHAAYDSDVAGFTVTDEQHPGAVDVVARWALSRGDVFMHNTASGNLIVHKRDTCRVVAFAVPAQPVAAALDLRVKAALVDGGAA